MEIKAKLKYLKMSPRKVRLVVDLIRGMEAIKALEQLRFMNKRAAKPVAKLINSAIANAEHNFELEKDNLYIKEIKVDEGATLHRWKPRARGRATPIRKRTSYINLVLAELIASGKKEAKKQKIEAPVKLGEKAPKRSSSLAGGEIMAGKKKATDKDKGVKIEDKDINKKTAEKSTDNIINKGRQIIDPRGEGHGKHAKIEGKSQRGFIGKMFRRKSG